MKKTILFHSILLISLLSYGQAQEGTVEYQKRLQPAAVIELPYPSSVVDAAMNDYLFKKGRSRSNDIKGFSHIQKHTTSGNGHRECRSVF